MKRMRVTGFVACAAVLCAGAALATATPQENCDKARITAWKTYVSCIDTVLAKDASCMPTSSCLPSFDEFAAFAKCRHTYFRQWTLFQPRTTLATSTCIGTRFTDNVITVTDNLSGLVWEKKTTDASVHDKSNSYSWSTGTNNEDGTIFSTFLTGAVTGLNVAGFAGANGWRLPNLAELQSIVLDFTCTGAGGGATCSCGSTPCIDGTFGPTQSSLYWSATSYVPNPNDAWFVTFNNGYVGNVIETTTGYVRAVRGGL